VSARACDLLAEARGLLAGDGGRREDGRRGGPLAGTWPRAVALLGRQALEQALDDFWRQRARGVEQASTHAQLLCLSTYLDDAEVVSSVRYAWHGLSRACHHHVYELPPTAEELQALLEAVERFTRPLT